MAPKPTPSTAKFDQPQRVQKVQKAEPDNDKVSLLYLMYFTNVMAMSFAIIQFGWRGELFVIIAQIVCFGLAYWGIERRSL